MEARCGTFGIDISNPGFTQFRDGSGPREFRKHIDFEPHFQAPPQVIVSLAGLDIERVANARLVTSAQNIDATGFDLVISTWADTRIWLVKTTWVAQAAV